MCNFFFSFFLLKHDLKRQTSCRGSKGAGVASRYVNAKYKYARKVPN